MKELLLKVIEILKSVIAMIDKKPVEIPLDGQTVEALQDKLRLVLIIGHDKKAPGAVMHRSQGLITEYMYNSSIAQMAREYGITKNVDVQLVYRDGVGISGALKKAQGLKPDACIELHFNSFNGMAQGTETLCTLDAQDQTFAKIVQGKICLVFERTGMSRGVKPIPRSSRGGSNVTGLPGIANCLVEPFFGDNEKEAQMAMQNKSQYAHALVDAFIEWSRK